MFRSISDFVITFEKKLIERNVTINDPICIEYGSKITMPFHAAYSGRYHQFNITFSNEQDFTANIEELVKMISAVSNNNVSFRELLLPKNSVEIACHCRRNKIIFRYLEAYELNSDKIMKRIDVLIQKS